MDIIDGDSLRLDNIEIRLAGIDAPEFNQKCIVSDEAISCGMSSRQHLRKLVGGNTVKCNVFGYDFYGRILASCYVGDILLNERMVQDGWAVDYGGYPFKESEARAAKRGIWASKFDMPEDFRVDLVRVMTANSLIGSLLQSGKPWKLLQSLR